MCRTGSALLGILLAIVFIGLAHADTLVCHDGRKLNGQVSRVPGGYFIKMKFAELELREDQVKEWIKEGASPAVDPKTPAPVKVADPAPAASTNTGPDSAKVRKAVDQLYQNGRAAMGAAKHSLARDHFQDAVTLDKRHAQALHGLALSYAALGDPDKARDALDRAVDIGGLDRAATVNAAVLNIAGENPMRAAKALVAYLQGKNALDEGALDLLAVALHHANAQARNGPMYRDAELLYQRAMQKIETQRSGQKRWGVQWLPAADVDAKCAAKKSAQAGVERAAIDLAQKQRMHAERVALLDEAHDRFERKIATPGYVRRMEAGEAQSRQALQTSTDAYNTALGQQVYEPYPTKLSLLPLDDTSSPAFDSSWVSAPQPAAPADDGGGAGAARRPAAPVAAPVVTFALPILDLSLIGKRSADAGTTLTAYAAGFAISVDLVVAAAPPGSINSLVVTNSAGALCEAEVLHSGGGLALLRLRGAQAKALPVAADFGSGGVTCPAFVRVALVEPSPDTLSGALRFRSGAAELSLSRNPRLAGSPLIAGGKVVGVETADRDADPKALPVVSLETLRQFLGTDVPAGVAPCDDPAKAMFHVTYLFNP